jgi:hypothetical protein
MLLFLSGIANVNVDCETKHNQTCLHRSYLLKLLVKLSGVIGLREFIESLALSGKQRLDF